MSKEQDKQEGHCCPRVYTLEGEAAINMQTSKSQNAAVARRTVQKLQRSMEQRGFGTSSGDF